MKTLICKSWTFDAAHCLPMLPGTHKCHYMHGHTYRMDLLLVGTPRVDGEYLGMVVDYDLLDSVVKPVLAQLDHKVLNEVPGLERAPTTELVAAWIFDHLKMSIACHGATLSAVRVHESSTTWAEVGEAVAAFTHCG